MRIRLGGAAGAPGHRECGQRGVLEGDILQMQEIYKYVRTGTAADGTVEGHFQATGVRPRFLSELVARGINIPGAYFDPSKPL